MKYLFTVIPIISFASTSLGQQWVVSCQDYDSFTQYECRLQQQNNNNGMVGGYCGLPSSCQQGPQVNLKRNNYYKFYQWKQQQQNPSQPTSVTCQDYDSFTQYECSLQQQNNNNGMVGGYCGLPSSCQQGPQVTLNQNNYYSFYQWKQQQQNPSQPSSVTCQDYDSFTQYECSLQQQNNNNGMVGGYCGLPSSCQQGPQVALNQNNYFSFYQWKQQQQQNPNQPSSVTCQVFDSYTQYKCNQQQSNNINGMVGGYCGLPSSCQNGPYVTLNSNNYNDFYQWQQQQGNNGQTTAIYCKEYTYFLSEMCNYQRSGYFQGQTFCQRPSPCSGGNGQSVSMPSSDLNYFRWWRQQQNTISFN